MKIIFVLLALAGVLILSLPVSAPPNKPMFNQFAGQPEVMDSLTAYLILEDGLGLGEPCPYNGPEDSIYICPTQEDIDDMVKMIRKRREGLPYTTQAFDCDDFATEAKYWATVWSYRRFSATHAGLLFGKAYVKIDGNYDLLFPGQGHISGRHVLNFFIRDDWQIFFYEPQTGRIASIDSFLYEGSVEILKLEF